MRVQQEMTPWRIGLGVPRRLGDPSAPLSPLDHRTMLRYAQLAEQLGFDSVWVPDHFFYEWPPGVFEPYPEAGTLLTAIGATTQHVQLGSLVLAAAFRHPALLAKIAGALQELTGGRLVLGTGRRMLALVARYASGWNWADGLGGDGAPFRSTLAELQQVCQRHGRDPGELEISCAMNVLVLADAAATHALVEQIGAATGWPPAKVRDRNVIGTPDEVAQRLAQAFAWGVTHLVCSLGGRPFTLWSEAMLELFASDVLPRLRQA